MKSLGLLLGFFLVSGLCAFGCSKFGPSQMVTCECGGMARVVMCTNDFGQACMDAADAVSCGSQTCYILEGGTCLQGANSCTQKKKQRSANSVGAKLTKSPHASRRAVLAIKQRS